jgi:hypothetical protein
MASLYLAADSSDMGQNDRDGCTEEEAPAAAGAAPGAILFLDEPLTLGHTPALGARPP